MEGLREIDLDDKDWGKIRILLAIPREAVHWGAFAPLRGTLWGDLIQEVSGTSMSDALHGFATPLMREIGRNPRDQARRLSTEEGLCRLLPAKACDLGSEERCVPSAESLLFCYEAPIDDGVQRRIATRIADAWSAVRYVVVVAGKEISFS